MAINKTASQLINEAKSKIINLNTTEGLKKLQDEAPKVPERKGKHTENYLYQALDNAEKCIQLLPDLEKSTEAAVKVIESNKDKDKHWQIKINYLLDALKVAQETYPLFAEEAKRRRALIQDVEKRGAWALERQKCKEDTLYWFENYAWTTDPRTVGIWALPFTLYGFQKELLEELEAYIFTLKSSLRIEKSRDMGISWEISAILYKHFALPKSGAFQALIGSLGADECDKIGDPSSVFEKIRIQARLQPLGLLPKGMSPDFPYMKAVNPEDGSSITGEAGGANFGRSGRFTCILLDEISAWEQDVAAITACQQSSPCKIYNSTARGTGNEFARMKGTIATVTLHWTKHPHKSVDWYEYQKLDMNSAVRVAQELDIDYSASQPNKVYSDWNEVQHVVTKSEVMRALPNHVDRLGNFKIPFGNNVVMGEDVGQTPEHAHVLIWFEVLKEGTFTVDGIDLSGCVLAYREMVTPTRSTPRMTAKAIKEAESSNLESSMIYERYISQEALTERDIYEDEYGLNYKHWSPDYNVGISRVRDYLEVTNLHEPHPFREYTRIKRFPDAEPIVGRPHIYFVSEDKQAELLYDKALSRYTISPAEDSDGFSRTRFEFPIYHYPSSEFGKEVKKMRPKKALDDSMDLVRCVATESFAPINPLYKEEAFENYLPQQLKNANILATPVNELGMIFLQRIKEKEEFDKQELGYSRREQVWNRITR